QSPRIPEMEMTDQPDSAQSSSPDTQHQRWLKYGSNVVLVSIIVIVLAGLLVYLAQFRSKRVDMTAMRVYSLKPQTLNLIHAVKSPIRLSVFTSTPNRAVPTTPSSSPTSW